jgi:hypothetical protein
VTGDNTHKTQNQNLIFPSRELSRQSLWFFFDTCHTTGPRRILLPTNKGDPAFKSEEAKRTYLVNGMGRG